MIPQHMIYSMKIKFLKTIIINSEGRYSKRSMRTLFIFFSLILGLSLLTTACRNKGSEPSGSVNSLGPLSPTPSGSGSPPQQVIISSTTPGTNRMTFTWALDPGSTGEAVVGVVAVLQEAALTDVGACAAVPANVLAHARDGSGESWRRSGSTAYVADNDPDGSTLPFWLLTAGTTYSLAVCSVSATKIRGDGNADGDDGHAIVRSITTTGTGPPPAGSPPQQVAISSNTPGTNTMAFTWALDPGSTGEAVVGVVAVLQEAALTPVNACENVPASVLTHARDGSGSGSGTSGGATYVSDNDADGSTLTFTGLTAGTTYSLAVCSVSATKIRGDGNSDGDDGHAIVRSITTTGTGPPPAGSPPQQVMISSTTLGTNTMTFTWALDPGSTGEAVVGVVAVLQEAALTPVNACENVPVHVLAHARDGSGEIWRRSGNTQYRADNDADGSTVPLWILTAGTTYSLALCSVSAAKIRGDGNSDGDNGHAVVQSVTTTSPAPDSPPQQIRIYDARSDTNAAGFRWSLEAGSTGEAVVGVVAVLQEAALTDTNACASVPENVLTKARDGSGSNSGMSGSTTYKAYHNVSTASPGGALVFRDLTAGTTYSLAVCSVSATKIRGDNTGGAANRAVVTSITTAGTGPPPAGSPPQQVMISSTTLGTNTMTFTWALDPGSTGEAVVGVVAVLQEAALTPVNACENVPVHVLAHARDGSGEIWRRSGNTQYRADNDADGSTVPFWILTAGTTYSLALCSVSAAKIRGDGNSDGDNGHAVVQSVTTTSPAPDSPPQQIRIYDARSDTNAAGFRWSLEAGSTGEAVVGVVAVLQEAALTDTNACASVPENVLTKARDGSGSNSGMSGSTTYKAYHNVSTASPGGALVFRDLTAGTTYSLAVCSVSATKIRGDNTGGAANRAVVTSITTAGTRPPLPTFPKQVTVPAPTSVAGSNSITVSWSVDTASTGRTVLGVVAVLKEQSGASASLDGSSACSEASDAIVTHARDGSGSGSETSDGTTYMASNSASGNLTFTDLMAMTDYSIAVCSVAYDTAGMTSYIRGDGNADGDDAHAVVRSGARVALGPVMSTEAPVKQITFTVSPTASSTDSIEFVWSVSATAVDSHEPVVGVVIALKEKPDTSASLDASNACITSSTGLTASIINHARGLSGTNNGMGSDGTQYRALNSVGGVLGHNLTITGLMAGTDYSVVVCSVSADNIRGDNSSTLADDDAVLKQVATNTAPPKQVMFSSTSEKKTITISWELDSSADTSHKDITGVVGVLSTSNISTRNACKVALAHGVVRYASGDDTGRATFQEDSSIHTIIYVASRGTGASSTSFMFTGLTPDTAYSVTVCSVLSVTNHRGNGSRDRNAAAVQSVTTLPSMPPKQIQFASMTPTATSTTITVGWAVSDMASESHEAVVGVVAVLKQLSDTPVLLGASDACAGMLTNIMGMDLLAHARGSSSSPLTVTDSATTYMAAKGASGSLTFTGLTPKKMYHVAACSVSADHIRGGSDEGMTYPAIVTDSAITAPGVVVLYKSESVLGSASDHAASGANFTYSGSAVGTTSLGVNICGEAKGARTVGDWGVSPQVGGTGYSNHTFYGSTNGTNGDFIKLPERLGVEDEKDRREVWVYHVAANLTSSYNDRTMVDFGSFHKPSSPVTLSELIAIDAAGNYTNIAKVKMVFRLLQNGNETTANSDFAYWSFTRNTGVFDTMPHTILGPGSAAPSCVNSASGGTPGTSTALSSFIQFGIFGFHGVDGAVENNFIGGSVSSRRSRCSASDKTVLCIARQDSGF